MPDADDIDVLIIGGGINGCGTFRDLCAQGVDCLLIERDDFCAGASAASSRLVHGGLKYLETGEFGLVKESLTERNRLLANAPHYVSALPTILPLRTRFSGILPSMKRFLGLKARMTDRGSLITRAGLILYDVFGHRFRTMPTHRILGRRALESRVQGLSKGIFAAGLYYEGKLSHAERLGLELVLDGEALNPASRALNHARIFAIHDGSVTFAHKGALRTVRPKVIVNAGGAWIDAVNRELGLDTTLMGGSKGSHLVIDHPELYRALNGQMVYFGTADGRVNLCYPFMGRVLVGATDVPVSTPDDATCDADELAYMISAMREIFPDIDLREPHVRYRFCGVRPLPRADGEIGLVTRDHSIAELRFGPSTPVLCLIGGKWTTFRAFSEEAASRVLRHLGRPRRNHTAEMAIGGGKDFPRTAQARADWVARVAGDTGLSDNRVDTLLERYGTTAETIAHACVGETMLPSLPDYSARELAALCRNERVETLADLVLRRTLIGISGRLTPRAVEDCARIASNTLGWSPERLSLEVADLPLDQPAQFRVPADDMPWQNAV
jgi:glycerol-3-phosphate dehydrogenase